MAPWTTFLAVLSCSALVSWSPAQAPQPKPGDLDFAKTWVFSMSLAGWSDPRLPGLPEENRQDDVLIDTLKTRGLPADHVRHLRDDEAKKALIVAALCDHVRRAATGDTLIVYYQGQGRRGPDGKARLLTYDSNLDDLGTALSAAELLDPIEGSFAGSRVMIFVDASYADGLVDAVSQLKTKHQYAVVAAASSSREQTSRWTFTAALVRAFGGDPRADVDNNGRIDLRDVTQTISDEMLLIEEQVAPRFLSPTWKMGFSLAGCAVKPNARIGRLCEVRAKDGTWSLARTEAVDGAKYRVAPVRANAGETLVVEASALREPRLHATVTADVVEVICNGEWRAAKVLKSDRGLSFVRLDGEPPLNDEWVGPSRLRPRNGGATSALAIVH